MQTWYFEGKRELLMIMQMDNHIAGFMKQILAVAQTCTRFHPSNDSAMIEVTDGHTPPKIIKCFGP